MTPLTAAVVDVEIALARHRSKTSRGTVSAAAYDEDALTLATRCGLALLDRNPDTRPSAMVVATLSAPLPEPGVAPFLAELFALQTTDSRPGVNAIEMGGTVSAGVGAISSATMTVVTGGGPVLVIATDDRRDTKGRPLGAGAVAILVAETGEVGLVSTARNESELFLDRWQTRGGSGVTMGDRSLDRVSPGRAFASSLGDRVLYSQTVGPTIERVGFPGAAAPWIALLASDLEVDGTVVVASSAGGISHAVEFTAGPRFKEAADRAAKEVSGGISGDPPPAPDESDFHPYMSHAMAHRERAQNYRLEGARDPESLKVFYPPPPAASRSGLEPFHLARIGTVATFARDHVFPLGAPLTMALVDLDGGGRFFGQVADGLEVGIGDRVELVLRRLHQAGGVPNYFWKIRQIEDAG